MNSNAHAPNYLLSHPIGRIKSFDLFWFKYLFNVSYGDLFIHTLLLIWWRISLRILKKKMKSLKSTSSSSIWLQLLHLCEIFTDVHFLRKRNVRCCRWMLSHTWATKNNNNRAKNLYFSLNRLSFGLIRRNQNIKPQVNSICWVVVYFSILWSSKLRCNYLLYTQNWPTIGTVTIKSVENSTQMFLSIGLLMIIIICWYIENCVQLLRRIITIWMNLCKFEIYASRPIRCGNIVSSLRLPSLNENLSFFISIHFLFVGPLDAIICVDWMRFTGLCLFICYQYAVRSWARL